MDISGIIKQLRRSQDWEQADLARELGTTQQAVSKWEAGTLPRAGALKKINALLRSKGMDAITISTVVGPSDAPPVVTAAPLLLIVNTQNDCHKLVQLAQDRGLSVFITSKINEAARFIEKA
jgi:transcriptional regulator with XRE-family HTH domain